MSEFHRAAEEWHQSYLADNAERIARKPSIRVSEHSHEFDLSGLPCSQCTFIHWLRTYAAERARMEAEGREVALAALDFDNWLGVDGVAGFHFGEPC